MSVQTHLLALGIPPATVRIATYFARNPTARPSVRELQRTLAVSSASAQRVLDRFMRAGALRHIPDGRMRRYAPRMDSALWAAVRLLIGEDVPVRHPARVHERAARYGIDLTQLQSMLALSVAQRIAQLDANATFIAEASRGKQATRVRGTR